MAKPSKYCALFEYTEYMLDNSLLLFGDQLRGLFGFVYGRLFICFRFAFNSCLYTDITQEPLNLKFHLP